MTNPRELAAVLADLGRAGVELAAHGDRVRHRPAALPPDLSARLAAHKAAVLGLLGAGYIPANADAGYVWAERLAVADELGMPTAPGSPAWMIATGESMTASWPRPPPTPPPDGWHVGNTPIKPGPFDTGPEIPTWTRELFAAS